MQPNNGTDHLNTLLSPNFKVKEFVCPCCGEEGIEKYLVLKLQEARDLLPPDNVIEINSAYRCEKHNKTVGGVENSAHRKGLGADIKCEPSIYRFHLIVALYIAGFRRIGIGKDFVHCDIDATKGQNMIWLYY